MSDPLEQERETMSEPKLSEDLQGELGQRLAAGQHAAWREAIQRSEALEARLSKMEEKLLSVLEVAVARGEKLGYADEDYREALAQPVSEQDATVTT